MHFCLMFMNAFWAKSNNCLQNCDLISMTTCTSFCENEIHAVLIQWAYEVWFGWKHGSKVDNIGS